MNSEAMIQEFADICNRAQQAKIALAQRDAQEITQALEAAAQIIRAESIAIAQANLQDMDYGRERNLSEALLDRLFLDEARIQGMANGLVNVARLSSPVGEIVKQWDNPKNGLKFQRITVALGVIGIIYESRPNVTVDAGALCLKAGNVVILRGGSESLHSSKIISDCLRAGLQKFHLPQDAVQLVGRRERYMVELMLGASGKIDLLIPRGGKGLTGRVMNEARVPVLAHLDGNCHIYLDQNLDPGKAIAIVLNSKMRRTGICGALETLLVHRDIAESILPELLSALELAGCALRGDAQVQAIYHRAELANEQDWYQEYLGPILAIKIVSSLEEACTHIQHYGSHHSDAIITEDELARAQFFSSVDSAIVMHNCSTQYADGGEFGMGAEIGIATGRLHARGPVAARELVTYKNLVFGSGQCRG